MSKEISKERFSWNDPLVDAFQAGELTVEQYDLERKREIRRGMVTEFGSGIVKYLPQLPGDPPEWQEQLSANAEDSQGALPRLPKPIITSD